MLSVVDQLTYLYVQACISTMLSLALFEKSASNSRWPLEMVSVCVNAEVA